MTAKNQKTDTKKRDELPQHVHVVRGFAAAPDHVRTRYYNPGEIYEVGSDLLPRDLAVSLLNENEPPVVEHETVEDDERITEPAGDDLDPSLDHASGRHIISAPPLNTIIRRTVEQHVARAHSEEEADRARIEGVYAPRSILNTPLGKAQPDQPAQGTLVFGEMHAAEQAQPAQEPTYAPDAEVQPEEEQRDEERPKGRQRQVKREEKEE